MSDDQKPSDEPEDLAAALTRFAGLFTADLRVARLGENLADTRLLIELARSAWNLALLPPDKRAARLEYALAVCPSHDRHEFRKLVRRMIEAKEAHFADDRRVINECSVEFEGRHVVVRVEAGAAA